MDNEIYFVKTKRGNDKLCVAGYYYTKNNSIENTTYWRCEVRSCPGRLVLKENKEITKSSKHSHAGSIERLHVLQTVSDIQEKAIKTSDSPALIISDVFSSIGDPTKCILPEHSNLSRNIRKARNRLVPKLPSTLNEVDIQSRFRSTIGGENWLIYDSGSDDDNRILMFSAPYALQRLASSDHWFSDGTFDSCPSIFYQLYTIHAGIHMEIHPLVYCLLPNKTEEIYVKMLTELVQYIEACGYNINVKNISIDFELAARNAYLRVLDDVSIHFCYFHFCQTTWRKIQQLGLASLYNTNAEFALFCRKANALAFVPSNDVSAAFEDWAKDAPHQATAFVEYFESTFIQGPARRNKRSTKPLFPQPEWNMYQLTLHDKSRTTNSVEAWHRRLSVLIRAKSNIYFVIDALRKEERVVLTRILQLDAGAPPKSKNSKNQRKASRMKAIVNDYENRSLQDYLRNIAINHIPF